MKVIIPKYTKYKIVEGDIFNRLTVIKYLHHNVQRKSIWLFKCTCGKESILQMDNVINGHTKSCGCFIDTKNRSSKEAPLNKIYGQYRNRAVKLKKDFKLDKEQFKEITSKDCHYCGDKPYQLSYNKNKSFCYTYNGIDRIDNTKGYIIDNILPCCGNCNLMKKDMTYEEFLNYIKKIYKNLNL